MVLIIRVFGSRGLTLLGGQGFGEVGGKLLEAGPELVLSRVPGEADLSLVALEQGKRELQETVGGEVHLGD